MFNQIKLNCQNKTEVASSSTQKSQNSLLPQNEENIRPRKQRVENSKNVTGISQQTKALPAHIEAKCEFYGS